MSINNGNSNMSLTKDTHGYNFRVMKTTLADRLKKAMTLRDNMTQSALAEASGVAQPTIWRLTNGKAKTSGRLIDIANALGVNAEWLANGVGEMEGPSAAPIPRLDKANQIPVWDDGGETDDFVISPKGKSKSSWRAYILKRNSGCAEAPSGSIVIADTEIKPGTADLVVASVNGSISVYRFLDGGENGFLSVDDDRIPLLSLPSKGMLIGVVILLLRDFRT